MPRAIINATVSFLLATCSAAYGQDVRNGKIAFSDTDTAGQVQIFTINPDGSDRRQLTSQGSNSFPAWSRDGSKMAFTSSRTGTEEIWTMDPDGRHQQQITRDTPGGNFTPDWSPDGTRIAFSSFRSDVGHPEVWVMDADGTNRQRLTFTSPNPTGPTWSLLPSWSPDGSKMVYASTASGSTQIWMMNADGSRKVQMTDGNGSGFPDSNAPEWSRDGSQIVFWSGFESRFGEVWVMNADGTNRRQLTNTTDPMNSDNPAWSPDGTKVVFDSNRSGPGTVGIWMMDADGANPHLLTSGSGQTSWQPVVGLPNAPSPDVVAVPARSLVMKDDSQGGTATKRRFRLRIRTMQEQTQHRVVPPARGSAGDPRANGATLTVYNSAGSGEAVSVALPPADWQALGTESNPRGYRFRDQSRTGPVQRVVVKPDIIRITAGKANWSYTLDEPTQERIAVRLRLGTATEWCTDVPAGANPASDRTDFFRGERKTPAPAACPPVPAGV